MKINYIGIIYLTFILSFTACEKFIDLQPIDKITSDQYWKKTGDLENYIVQFYPIFFPYSAMVSQLAIDSDDIVHGNPSIILNGERTPSTGTWTNDWKPIRDINIFFENYEKCEDDFNEYKHIVGEAYFFRAWFYYNLLNRYGDIPWFSEVIQLNDHEKLHQPRLPRNQICDKILSDLDHAIQFLDRREMAGNLRINKEAALAFKTRVALFEGSWQKYHKNTNFGTLNVDPNKYFMQCVNAAEELINGGYNVGIYNTGKGAEDYYTLFGLKNMSEIDEVLLYKEFSLAEGFGNTVEGFLSYNANQKGITWNLVTSYLGINGKPYDYYSLVNNNVRGNDFLLKIAEDCDPRLSSTIYIPGDLRGAEVNLIFDKPTIDKGTVELCPTGFQIKKTTNPYSSGAGQTWEVGSETGLIIFRYAEVLLNYAEALFEINGEIAFDALNLLRTRVNMPQFTVTSQELDQNRINYGYNIPDGLYEIRRERRVELALEGHRSSDYRRWAAHSLFKGQRPKGYPFEKSEFPNLNPALDQQGLVDFYRDVLPDGYQFREDKDYLSPIPQTELILNPSLEQNPGW